MTCAMPVQDPVPPEKEVVRAIARDYASALQWAGKRLTPHAGKLELKWRLINTNMTLLEVLYHLDVPPEKLNTLRHIKVWHKFRRNDFAVGDHLNTLLSRLDAACKHVPSALQCFEIDIRPFGVVSPPALIGKFYNMKSVSLGAGRIGALASCLRAFQNLEELTIYGSQYRSAFLPELNLASMSRLRLVQLKLVNTAGRVTLPVGCELSLIKRP